VKPGNARERASIVGLSFWASVVGAFLITVGGGLYLANVTESRSKARAQREQEEAAATQRKEIEQHFADNPDHVHS
jgi:hypothetical protein